jgi:tetratricopeptide (TPR) repeat protein
MAPWILLVCLQFDLVGQRVITTQAVNLDAGRKVFRVYRVREVDNQRLRIAPEKGGREGWVSVEDVILYDQAIDYLTAEIRTSPDPYVYNWRGNLYYERGEYDAAIGDYSEAIRLDPKLFDSHRNRGLSRSKKKDFDGAVLDFDEAIRLDPLYAPTYFDRGLARRSLGQLEGALADFDEAIRIAPTYLKPYVPRGKLRQAKGQDAEARADFEEAIRLDPASPYGYINLAWLLARGDPTKAVEVATRACELSGWKDAGMIQILAAIHATSGDFDAAVQWQEKAVKLSGQGRDRLEAYRARKRGP